MSGAADFGIAPTTVSHLHALFEAAPGLRRVWMFGSRARGDARPESDIDLAFDAPGWTFAEHAALAGRIESLNLLYKVDAVLLQDTLDAGLRAAIERDRRLFWEVRLHAVDVREVGGTQLKKFQSETLLQLDRYLVELARCRAQSDLLSRQLSAMEGADDLLARARDFPRNAWAALKKAAALPPKFAHLAHSSRFDGAGRPIPNVCLKIPTGGGKTLLAAASVGKVFGAYFNRHSGLVLWVVPNEAIYRQTLRTLADRDHPYRQMLNLAGAGRVKVLEKDSPLTRLDVESHLCVMVLMLASAARQSKETLRFFRDRGNVLGFLPREDDVEAHWKLLGEVPNLDAYGSPWASAEEARAQKGSIVKSSLGNVMRLLRPMVVMDEGHHGYTENALRTIDGFNPGFMLELSATPRVPQDKEAAASGSNILVDVRGTDLDEAEMIKLPIQVDVRHWTSWQSCLDAGVRRLDALQAEAAQLLAETGRYIRPILLVQVERTGRDQVDAGFIHALHVREYLAQLGMNDRQIREKTSEKDDIGDEDLLSPASEVRVIVTKQALQEGWDCPFAYVLCTLSASKGRRAMTQLVGRILRMPHVAKTGRPALDACYVLCHDASTGEVVKAIKESLEGEGMGDLAGAVRSGSGDGEADGVKRIVQRRRPRFSALRLFAPRVTWVGPGAARRELQYDSDVLARVAWERLDTSALAKVWAPTVQGSQDAHLEIGLSVLEDDKSPRRSALQAMAQRLDAVRIVRALVDIVPNPWLVWSWVADVLERLGRSWDQERIAQSESSLVERLRADLEVERDRLAHEVFTDLVKAGQIEFRLRADATDYELPHEAVLEAAGKPVLMTREDDFSDIDKSLLVPALRTPDMNEFEAVFAGYLDAQEALAWWHRNVARTQYGLQGWKRHKVYPDFVFGFLTHGADTRVVLLETKGLHLAGNADTGYKQALLAELTAAYSDERFRGSGELALEGGRSTIECDLVFDQAWRGAMDARYFG